MSDKNNAPANKEVKTLAQEVGERLIAASKLSTEEGQKMYEENPEERFKLIVDMLELAKGATYAWLNLAPLPASILEDDKAKGVELSRQFASLKMIHMQCDKVFSSSHVNPRQEEGNHNSGIRGPRLFIPERAKTVKAIKEDAHAPGAIANAMPF